MRLYVKRETEWLYPDEPSLGTEWYHGELIELHTSAHSPVGFQLLAAGIEEALPADGRAKQGASCGILFDGGAEPEMEINILRPVQVNFNTAEEAEGFDKKPFVYRKKPETLPKQCTRLAPFWVYDAYLPYEEVSDGARLSGQQAFYLCFPAEEEAGVYEKKLTVRAGDQELTLKVLLHIYDTGLTKERKFFVSNWFSISNMANFHGIPLWSEAHFDMIGRYADAMKRMRQTHFMLTAQLVTIQKQGDDYVFDLARLERVAKIFFEKGFLKLAFGPVGTRERVQNETLKVLGLSDVPVDSEEGRKALRGFFQAFGVMAEQNGWMDRIVFHLADEPDEPAAAIPGRLKQYAQIHRILKEYFPRAEVCEAVKTAAFRDYIDTLVPLSKTYEDRAQEFVDSGRTIWCYICCVPTGDYYQRFLDIPLVSSRYLFWAIAKQGFGGYLHWGLNQMEPDQHPFEQTNQYHTYGDGVCLPAGDSHVVYPDGDRLYYSMRLESCRKGSEDVELLKLLKERNPQAFARITEEIQAFHGAVDAEAFEGWHIQLLKELAEEPTARAE